MMIFTACSQNNLSNPAYSVVQLLRNLRRPSCLQVNDKNRFTLELTFTSWVIHQWRVSMLDSEIVVDCLKTYSNWQDLTTYCPSPLLLHMSIFTSFLAPIQTAESLKSEFANVIWLWWTNWSLAATKQLLRRKYSRYTYYGFYLVSCITYGSIKLVAKIFLLSWIWYGCLHNKLYNLWYKRFLSCSLARWITTEVKQIARCIHIQFLMLEMNFGFHHIAVTKRMN